MDANNIKTELDELLAKLSDPEFLSSAQGEAKKAGARIQKLQRMLTAHEALKNTENELRALEDLKKESGATDEIAALEAEIAANAEAARAKIAELENENVSAPPPSDMIMEIRAGAGGNEASLFAAELFSLYSKFAERRGWEVNIISKSESEASGYKEIIFEINGQDAYKTLRYESGVHRVQRIPITEKQGRIAWKSSARGWRKRRLDSFLENARNPQRGFRARHSPHIPSGTMLYRRMSVSRKAIFVQ